MFSAPLIESPLLLVAVLLYQCVIVQCLGLCPLSGRAHQHQHVLRVAAALAMAVLLSILSTGLIQQLFLRPLALDYFDTVVAVLSVAISAQITRLLMTRYDTSNSASQPAIAVLTQIAVLGTVLLALQKNIIDIGKLIVLGIGAAIGFALIYVLFATLRERLLASDIPQPFRGAAIQFITAGLAALALMGLAGVV